MEHRQAQRESTEITVMLSTIDGVTRKAQIKDVSSLGAGIVINGGSLSRGTVVELRLSSKDARQVSRSFRAHGYVVRANGTEFGLLWIEENPLSPFNDNRKQDDINPANELMSA
ncbi:MAG: PilZ domain-containing protein [Gammaproteobacteria bacterium]|jgi:hypothetical protein